MNLFFDANACFQTFGFVGLLPLVMGKLALKGLCMYIVCSSIMGIKHDASPELVFLYWSQVGI